VPAKRTSSRKTARPAKKKTIRAAKSVRAAKARGRRASRSRRAAAPIDYTKVCFVIMPFGTKPVGKRKVNFDRIYDEIFVPAVAGVPLPEGGKLVPRRTDRDFFAGDIGQEMFAYLQWSRFALADITSLNPNVMYEVGVRHSARESGTAIFRQGDAPIPFDINHIKAFPYNYQPEQNAAAARKLIRRVLMESLVQNRLDSPVQIALKAQRTVPEVEPILKEVETLIRAFNRPGAIAKLREANAAMPGGNALIHQRLGLLLRDQGDLQEALSQFDAAVKLQASYSEAWREKGIVQGKLQKGSPEAEAAIRQAIQLNPNDFDALASLGGLLRKMNRLDEALGFYRRAVEVSEGHPYPLLMVIKLEALVRHALVLTDEQRRQLRQAELMRRAQAESVPPLDAPWCFFDMAEIRLYQGDAAGFLDWVKRGLGVCTQRWQAETFRSALLLLVDGGVALDGLGAGLALIDVETPKLPA